MAGMTLVKGGGVPAHRPPRTEFTRRLVELEVGDAIMVREGLKDAPSKDAAAMAASNWGRKLGRVFRVDRLNRREFGVWRVS